MKKIGSFFFCFLPLIASVSLQFAASFFVMGFCLLQICLPNFLSGKKMNYVEFARQFSVTFASQTNVTMISVVFAICGLVIFGIWYSQQFHGNLHFPMRQFSKPSLLLSLILLVPGLQMISSILTGIIASLFPFWMDFYEKLMENAGLTSTPTALLVLYAVLIGPIEEELTFRGVIFSSAKKALPFWAANLFQAILFGIFHMNLVQGVYALFIGLFLGYVCERGGSIWISIFLHVLFNFWGTFLSSASGILQNPLYYVFFLLLSIFLGILGMYLFVKNTRAKEVKHFPEISDM